ncbi:hypothetical protein [Acidovorax sp. sic0104]|uniref:hypothetical protein n=1 Tax=Acidovorax sp. sic0104 TaxID=2854784 RepID=UPI001C456F3A|nr:hypothetical protein [Acidovorax sp. sic0104]MBV7542046.1 hypothetical protein [Acidovorax sp. sic0104]
MNDSVLSDLLRNQRNPIERLVSLEEQSKTHNGWFASLPQRTAHFLATGKRIVRLECRHYVLTRSLFRAACPRCGEMIRAGYDYDAFRRLGAQDEFRWAEDPLWELNEGHRA